MTARILITGADGQIGGSLRKVAAPGFDIRGYGHRELDICSVDDIDRVIGDTDLVVNAAAYTAVDAAETNREAAYTANAQAPGLLAAHCARLGVPLIHLSTDYVFDGTRTAPWAEDDLVSPLNVYGASKAAGEAAVRRGLNDHVIIRTSWVFSAYSRNFVHTMLENIGTADVLKIVDDQIGSPTSAEDVAAAILVVARHVLEQGGPFGTYHYTAEGSTSWFGLAEAIFDLAVRSGKRCPTLQAVSSAAYRAPARRPLNSVLDCSKIISAFAPLRRPWREGAKEVVVDLLNKKGEARG